MKRKISSEELSARLNLAEEINKKFPFLIGNYTLSSSVKVDQQGNEVGSIEVQILSSKLLGEQISMYVILGKYLNKILSEDIKKQNDELRKENAQLKIKLEKKNANKISKQPSKVVSKIITSPNG